MIGIERGTESKRLYENTITAVSAVVAIDTSRERLDFAQRNRVAQRLRQMEKQQHG